MKTFTKIALAAALAITGITTATNPAKADIMNCYGSTHIKSCTWSGYANGEYTTCYGTITRYNENWNCF